jgi:hypothetical protein
VLAAVLDPLGRALITVGLKVGEAALRSTALAALCLALTPFVLSCETALGIALNALVVAAVALGAHCLAFTSASTLDLAFTAMALHLSRAAFTTTSATTLHALALSLMAAAATLRLRLSATTAFRLGLTVSAAAPVGLRGCRGGNRKGRDTGRENEVPHLESPIRFAVTTTRGTRRSTF